MKRIITSTPENEGFVCDDTDARLLTPEGEWEIPSASEELLLELGLTAQDYYRRDYE